MHSLDLSRALRLLPLDGRLEMPRAAFAGAFAHDIATLEGRAALYTFANVHQCRVEWNDAAGSVAFLKQRVLKS